MHSMRILRQIQILRETIGVDRAGNFLFLSTLCLPFCADGMRKYA